MHLFWQLQIFRTTAGAEAPVRKALNPLQGTLLILCKRFLPMVLGVLETELKVLQTDTALLASSELNEFTP